MSQLKIKDGNSWINIPAGGIGVPSGGNQGDVLVKSSSTDYATEWALPLSMTLLWTNPSPTSAFAAQTVSLDLSAYDAVLIDTGIANDDHRGKTFTCFVGRTYYMDAFPLSLTARYGRAVDILQTGLVFSEGYFNTGVNNVCVIPLKIYGIKGIT